MFAANDDKRPEWWKPAVAWVGAAVIAALPNVVTEVSAHLRERRERESEEDSK